MNSRNVAALAAAVWTSLAGLVVAQTPAGTSFTYQGRVKQNGAVVNDDCDFEFKLFDSVSGPNQIGSTITLNNIPVNDGLFTVELDFGASSYGRDARWLEMAVKIPPSGSFVTVGPRQRLTGTPFSLATRGIEVDTPGNVGIGTANPSHRLHVVGEVRVDSQIGYGHLLRPDGIGVAFAVGNGTNQSNGSFEFRDSVGSTTNMVVANGGNVGIGTTNPSSVLGAATTLQVGTTSTGASLRLQGGSVRGFEVHSGAAGSALEIFPTDNTDISHRMVYTAGGNLGIGTTAPATRLHIDSGAPNVPAGLTLQDGSGRVVVLASPGNPDNAKVGTVSGHDFEIMAANTTRIFVRNLTGNVGIGTTDPLDVLHVRSTGSLPSLQCDHNGSARIRMRPTGLGSNIAVLENIDGALSINPNGGNVGIGTTSPDPDFLMQVKGGNSEWMGGIASGGNSAAVVIGEVNGIATIGAHSGALDAWGNLSINPQPGAFVGIGTASPGQQLDVAGNIRASGSVFATCGPVACSDRRFKDCVHQLVGALDLVVKLRGVAFEWKREEFPEWQFSAESQVGFIAQEIEEHLPQVVVSGSDGYKSVDYGRVTPVLVEAIKEQQCEIEELRGAVAEKDRLIADLAARLDRLEARLITEAQRHRE